MIRYHTRISEERQSALRDHLDALWAPRLTSDKSSYAPDRMTAWIGLIPTFSRTPTYKETEGDERIMDYANRLARKAGFTEALDLALVHRGGNIDPHRDATYAKPLAFTINLGICTFRYKDKTYSLEGGEVFSFDCKEIHGVSDAAADRWAINLWTRRKPEPYLW